MHGLQNAVAQEHLQLHHIGCRIVKPGKGSDRLSKSRNAGHVFRAGAQTVFLAAAKGDAQGTRSVAHRQRANAFGAVNFMAGEAV